MREEVEGRGSNSVSKSDKKDEYATFKLFWLQPPLKNTAFCPYYVGTKESFKRTIFLYVFKQIKQHIRVKQARNGSWNNDILV
jgi:hypothetical protein